MNRTGGMCIALALAVAACSGAFAAEQQQTPGKPTLVRRPARSIGSTEGKDLYIEYCASCHGKTGKGDGPAVPALKVVPPDLTMLGSKNGGQYPAVEVEQMIAGQGRAMAAHGNSDMPIWGHIFYMMDKDTGLETLRIKNLTAYLKSLQQ